MYAAINMDLYIQLEKLPESLTGEILNGQLYTHPRPGGRHILVSANLGAELHGPFQKSKGGPGGWWILQEPEVHFSVDKIVVVPDLAGWRKERLPQIPESHKFTIVPDWICEISSPSTESVDKEIKMPLYAEYGVNYLWIIHPLQKTLHAYKRAEAVWQLQGSFSHNDVVNLEPFESIRINVADLME